MQCERRNNRSVRPFEALQIFLDATRAKLGVRALTLGTPDGALIAGAGDDLERVAGAGADMAGGACRTDPSFATWRTQLGDDAVVLTSWGAAMSPDLADGIRRILVA